MSSFDCYLIGDNSLVVSCGEVLLEKGHRILGVISPSSAAQRWAEERQLAWIDSGEDYVGFLKRRPFDYLFSIVNHRVLAREVLELPGKFAINYHDALLPRYAGIHATAWAIAHGESEHGVTWHLMNEVADAGDVLKSRKLEISESETSQSLNLKCYEAAVASFTEMIADLAAGRCSARAQDAEARTYFSRYERPTPACLISWELDAQSIDALVRACDFGPHENTFGAPKCLIASRCVLVRATRVCATTSQQLPGTIVDISAQDIKVATKDYDLLIEELADCYGNVISVADLAARYHLAVGSRLGLLDQSVALEMHPVLARVYRQEADWVKKLARCSPLDVPYRKRDSKPLQRGSKAQPGRLLVELAQAVSAGLEHGSQTWHDRLLAAFLAFLGRVSGRSNFCVGLGIGSADENPLARAVLAKYLPFEVVLDCDNASAEEFLRIVGVSLQDAQRRQTHLCDVYARYPGLQQGRSMGPGTRLRIVVDKVESLADVDPERSLDDGVELAMYLDEDKSRVLWIYDGVNLEAEDATRLADQFLNFLSDVVARPTARISALSLLSPKEKHRILVAWNDTKLQYPQDKCVHELVDEQAARSPDAVALSCKDQQLTYRELKEQSSALAAQLNAAGFGAGDYVGVFMDRSLDLGVALLGILKSGAAYIPLDPTHPKKRIAMMIDDSGLSALLVDSHLLHVLAPSAVHLIVFDDHRNSSPRRTNAHVVGASNQGNERRAGPSDVAYMIYTSGSTGKPKGVPVRHQGLTNLFTSMRSVPGIGPSDRILALTTISFDIACVELFLPLICGGSVDVLPADIISDGLRLRKVLEDSDATIVQATPATWRLLLAAGWNLRKPIRIWCGGEALAPQLARMLLDRCEELWNCYGPTETTIYACFHKVADPDEIAIGRPVANTQMYILDSALNPVPVGIAGELYIGGHGLSAGYHERAQLNQKSFLLNPFDAGEASSRLYRTGDSCRYWRNGSVEYLGRLDNQVKIRGFRIELGEIESVLARHPGAREAIAEARDDEHGNKKIVAYVVPTSVDEIPTAEELRKFLHQHLPSYMVPSSFVYLRGVPLSPNGKVDRKALHLAQQLPRRAAADVAGRTREERRIGAVWQDLLPGTQIELHDNFFDVGGDSILLVQMAQRLSREYAREFSSVEMLRFPTIASFAGYVSQLESHEEVRSVAFPDSDGRLARRAGRLKRKQALKEVTNGAQRTQASSKRDFNG